MGLRLQQVDARVLIKTRNHRFLFLWDSIPGGATKREIVFTISLVFYAMKFHVYILQSTINGSFYIGQTGNIERRLNDHNKGFSKATARYSL
jgi:hypothetical protein